MKPGRILGGLVLIGLGAVFLADRLSERFEAGPVLADWWPVVLVAAGVIQLIVQPRTGFGALLVIALGLLLLAGNLELLRGVGLGIVWPLLLILLGLRLLYRGAAGRAARPPATTADELVMFAERDIAQGSRPFRGGTVTAVFGGATVDLREAEPEEGAVLGATAIFGGVDVIVPEGWGVRLTGFPVFGGIKDETVKGAAPRLDVRATAVFGRVEVRNAP